MSVRDVVSAYRSELTAVSERVYDARRRFFVAHFEGYVEDTYYFVPDSGYYCWPAQTDGVFEGYTEILPEERRALEPLLEAGFEFLGVGTSRVVCRFPPHNEDDLVVKIGRCGMGEAFGTGRHHNLVEAQISNANANANGDLPVLPSLFCEPRGRFAVYPYAQTVSEGEIGDERRGEVAAAVRERVPTLREAEFADPKNLCRWKGDLYTLDYCEFEGADFPLGVPAHVDHDEVIDAVDRLRRRGEKKDIDDPLRLVSPVLE
ncbi:hypothetical protein [Natronoglomus mannanivorans]|uniref:Uncharacterized protein n=1 Tax=Natronoglomus mannanivorans TaxID=2979990 RepID=A0AAP3E1D2_9EURY|nr:hypothetical protein [Halobacteria archaeon AArc-xg1-1]